MLKQTVKVFFLGQAAIELSREKIDEYVNSLITKVAGAGQEDAEKIEILKSKLREAVADASSKVMQRSEVLEAQFSEKIRRQVADFSLETLGDSNEINELRAEIASLRAELVQLRASRVSA